MRDKLHGSLDKKSKQHSLFIGPRGSGKTHLLSLIAQEIHSDVKLAKRYVVARFPEESMRLLSYVDLLLGVCENLKDTLPQEQASVWNRHYEELVEEPNGDTIRDTLEAEIKRSIRDTGKTLLIMLENFDEILTKQMKQKQDAASMRKLFMGDNGCMLVATAPLYFSAVTDVNQPFYDFFDVQLLSNLSEEETVRMIRLNLEWDKNSHKELLDNFNSLRPKIFALHQITDGNPRLTMMLYELIAHDSILSARDQFMRLLDRITPFYQDRIKDIPPQERAILETMAKMRGVAKTPAAIAARMRMGQQQTSMLLKRLNDSNYVKSIPNPDDKRSRIYVIREGFFDLWLAMNLSRAEYVRLPFLIEFFEKWYRSLDEREERRRSLHALLKQTETREEATVALDYLSEVGSEDEKAAAKIALAKSLSEVGVKERSAKYVGELQSLKLNGLGGWIADHAGGWQTGSVDFYADLDQMIQCWKTQRSGDLEAFIKNLRNMGDSLTLKTYTEAKVQFLEESLKHVTAADDRIRLRTDLATLFRDLTNWEKAKSHLTTALQEAELENSPHTLTLVLSMLALVHLDLAQYQQAEPLMRRALEVDERSFGPDHPNVARSINNLAQVLTDTNRIAEAEPLMRRALEIGERSLGTNHPTVAIRLNNLAQLLSSTNRTAEAESLMRRALEIDEHSFGPDHPEVAVDLNNLAQLLEATNRIAEAEPLMRRALEIGERSFGPDHPKVASHLNNLAQLLADTNRIAEAEPLLRRALEIDERSFCPDHPDVAVDLNNLAQLLKATNRFAEAEPLMHRHLVIFQRFKRSTGFDHPKMSSAIANYTTLLEKMGCTDEQVKLRLKEVLEAQ
jgi:tetratricopeptide (TPR) repeat protein